MLERLDANRQGVTSPRRPAWLALIVAAALALAGCSSDAETGGDAGPGHDGATPTPDGATPTLDGATPTPDGATPTPDQGQGVQPPPPAQSGVVYVSHFYTNELRYYRVDGPAPLLEGQIDLGKISHDMALDPFNDLLYVVADVAREVEVFKLSRPGGVGQPLTPPAKLSTITLADKKPLFARVDPHHGRLYVIAAPPIADLVTEYELFAYDVSDPAAPQPIAGSPYKVPVSASIALDAWRQRLFLVAIKDKKLFAYDVSGDKLQPLGGAPIELEALYPQENSYSFQARSLVADPLRRRLYAARSQGVLSELIAFEYPEALTAMDQLKKLDDPLDVDKPAADRPNLLDAFEPKVDLARGHVLMSAGAHDGVSVSAVVVGFPADLSRIGGGCKHVEGFGCWYQYYLDNTAGAKKRTDGAACVDATHAVFVGTGLAGGDESDPGTMHFFRYQDDLQMQPLVPTSGKSLAAGGLPIAAVCH